jgi:uncharacterized protein (DUF302 family)
MRPFGIHARFDGAFDEAVAKVTAALMREGFGVLTEIDVQATFKKKLDVDFRRYQILGACNPQFAHRALTTDLTAGLLLPCNVALWEENDGTTHIAAVDPVEAMEARGEPRLLELATEVRDRLARAIAEAGGT